MATTDTPPPFPPQPTHATRIPGRRPEWKFHKNGGLARTAVLQKKLGQVWRWKGWGNDGDHWELEHELSPDQFRCVDCGREYRGAETADGRWRLTLSDRHITFQIVAHPGLVMRCYEHASPQAEQLYGKDAEERFLALLDETEAADFEDLPDEVVITDWS